MSESDKSIQWDDLQIMTDLAQQLGQYKSLTNMFIDDVERLLNAVESVAPSADKEYPMGDMGEERITEMYLSDNTEFNLYLDNLRLLVLQAKRTREHDNIDAGSPPLAAHIDSEENLVIRGYN